ETTHGSDPMAGQARPPPCLPAWVHRPLRYRSEKSSRPSSNGSDRLGNLKGARHDPTEPAESLGQPLQTPDDAFLVRFWGARIDEDSIYLCLKLSALSGIDLVESRELLFQSSHRVQEVFAG